MTVIRNAQRAALAALHTDDDLVAHVEDVVRTHCPGRFDGLAPGFVVDRVRQGIARARAHGLADEGDLCSFVLVMFEVSARFDEHPVLRRVLTTGGGTPAERYARLFAGGLATAWEEASSYPYEAPDAEAEAWDPGVLAREAALGLPPLSAEG